MDIFDILDNFLDDLENGVGLDFIDSNHGKEVDKYYEGDIDITWYVYEDGFKVGLAGPELN